MAHSPATRDMLFLECLGNLLLLIVGGNDTTRNSISGGVLALNQNPDEYRKLNDDPSLIASMVPEIIRWQTPLTHMRRTALQDWEIGGKQIKKGDKVVMRSEEHTSELQSLMRNTSSCFCLKTKK